MIQSIIRSIRCYLEDEFFTAPWFLRSHKLRGNYKDFSENLNHLRENGYCSIDKLLNQNEIIEIQKIINQKISEKDHIYVNEVSNYIQILKPLLIHESLTKAAVNPKVLDLVEAYFGRESFVADLDMRRIHPESNKKVHERGGYTSSSWHRDVRGRQLKLMIYLTHVYEKDSNFAFIPASHRFKYARKNFNSTRFSDDVICKTYPTPIEWYGRAGEAYLFDTNLIHRLRRKENAHLRDSFTVYFTPGQELRKIELNDKCRAYNSNSVLQNPKSFLFKRR